jgi:hypothetical protein
VWLIDLSTLCPCLMLDRGPIAIAHRAASLRTTLGTKEPRAREALSAAVRCGDTRTTAIGQSEGGCLEKRVPFQVFQRGFLELPVA